MIILFITTIYKSVMSQQFYPGAYKIQNIILINPNRVHLETVYFGYSPLTIERTFEPKALLIFNVTDKDMQKACIVAGFSTEFLIEFDDPTLMLPTNITHSFVPLFMDSIIQNTKFEKDQIGCFVANHLYGQDFCVDKVSGRFNPVNGLETKKKIKCEPVEMVIRAISQNRKKILIDDSNSISGYYSGDEGYVNTEDYEVVTDDMYDGHFESPGVYGESRISTTWLQLSFFIKRHGLDYLNDKERMNLGKEIRKHVSLCHTDLELVSYPVPGKEYSAIGYPIEAWGTIERYMKDNRHKYYQR